MRRKYYLLSTVILLLKGVCYAQKTEPDSLKNKVLLEDNKELKLNPEAVKMIDFGSAVNSPRTSEEKSWLLPDETLPQALPKPKVVLTLMPYKPNTPYNWDPIYQKKIKVDKDTWRGDPFYALRRQRSYTNWAHNPMEAGERKSLDEIQAVGVRSVLLNERANGMMVSTMRMDRGIPVYGGGSGSSKVTVNGGSIGGLDLMAVFTKNFWDKSGRKNRERTLEVLKTYGDSTTVLINIPLEQIVQ